MSWMACYLLQVPPDVPVLVNPYLHYFLWVKISCVRGFTSNVLSQLTTDNEDLYYVAFTVHLNRRKFLRYRMDLY
jgi:hypothetical protein